MLPALLLAAGVYFCYRRMGLTPLLYIGILLHSVVLMVGGHYTYAEVPLFDNLLGAERNNYDKLGHLFQGLVPALIAREWLLRQQVINPGVACFGCWLNLYIVAVCLAFSASYELIEWWVALATGASAEAFLGTQGYSWDTQSDMAFALLGALLALLCCSRIHDRQLAALTAG